MYRALRVAHRWAGLMGSIFLVLIALSGFFLSLKRRFEWIQPKTGRSEGGSDMATIEQLTQAALSAGVPQMRTAEDIARFEIHLDRGVVKALSERGYMEVQLDAFSAQVLSVGKRNDQFFESLHDLSLLHPLVRDWVLPVVAVLLFLLGVSGVIMFFTPMVRRWRHRRGTAQPRA